MPKIRKLGGASSEQGDAGKPVIDADDTDSTTDASANADAGSDVADAAAGEQTTENKSEATDGAATEESKSDAANGAETEESKSDAAHGTGAEESKADAGHGSHAGGSSVVGAGSVGIDESTGAAVEIEETKPAELLEEETKLATESEIPKEEDEKKFEENRKLIYTDIRAGIKVTATLEDADAVPDEARLHVTEIKNDKMYAAYLEAMDEAEPEIKHTKKNTVLRDISFIMKDENGKEIEYEPTEGSVKITIEYLENHLQDWFGVEDAAEVKTYHLPLAEGVKAEGEKTIDVQNVKASDINVQELDSDVKTEKKVEVEVDSFSMFAMRAMRLKARSMDPGKDLSNFITGVKIIGATKDENGNYTIKADSEYEFELSVAETPGGLQFDNEGPLEYTLPVGFEVGSDPDSLKGICEIECTDAENHKYTVKNTWRIEGRKLIFDWNKKDEHFDVITDASNTKFFIHVKGKVSEGAEDLAWSEKAHVKVTIDTANRVDVQKEGSLELSQDRINYIVTVTSSGKSKDVEVMDTITGAALTYNNDAVISTDKYNQYAPAAVTKITKDGNGFKCEISEMKNNEKLYIKYSATIDRNKITENGTVEQTGNSVSAHSKDQTDPSTANKTFENQINYTPTLTKYGRNDGEKKDGYQTIPYTIEYNKNRLSSVANNVIKDTIDENSQSIMDYAGDVTIKVYDSEDDSVLKATRTITPVAGEKTWSYKIPETDTGKYRYVFTYNAKVKISELTGQTPVSNSATDNKGVKADSSIWLGPDTSSVALGVAKKAVKSDYNETTWEIELKVPKEGVRKAEVTDIYPHTEIDGKYVFDHYKANSFSIENSEKDKYEFNSNATITENQKELNALRINFPDGLKATGKERTIKIRLTTVTNEEWAKKAANDNNWVTHTNTVKVKVDEKSFNASAELFIVPNGITKKFVETKEEDGLPVYKYEVLLTGVKEKTFTVEDLFPTKYLVCLPTSDQTSESYAYKAEIRGGNAWWQPGNECGTVTVDNTTTGADLHVTLTDDPLDKLVSDRLTHYTIVYYLRVKDKDALKKLMKDAYDNGGQCELTNEARYNGGSDTVSHVYNYDKIKKELINADQLGGGNNIAQFRITVNPGALRINNGENYTLTDTFSNLSIDYDSIKINTEPQKDVHYNFSANQGKFEIPDETEVTITYNARVLGTGEITFTNVAEIMGTKSAANKTVTIDKNAIGSASNKAIKILKYEEGDMSTTLKGAKFGLYYADGANKDKEITNVTTDVNGKARIYGSQDRDGWTLNPGWNYYIKEIKAPEKYNLNETEYHFSIGDQSDPDSNIYCSGDTIAIPNTPKTLSVTINKKKVGGELLPGAKLQLFKGSEKIDEWTTADAGHSVTVKPGTYTLHEDSAPNGYKKASDITFSVDEAGKIKIGGQEVTEITMIDDYSDHSVTISKTTAGGSELEGAVLELTDATGALVDKWTSTTTARTFELKPGTYKFHEVSAPSGYLVADDITFTVTIDGMITVDGKTVDKVVMIDRKKPEETTVPETTPAETTPAETTVPETTPAETTTPSGGGGGGGNHPHPLPETTPAETTPAETTVPETTPVETTNPGGGHGGSSEEVETDEYGRVRGANRGKNKKSQDGGNVKGASRGKTRTGDESMMSIFGFGFLAAVLVLLGWFGIRFTKRNHR